MPDGTSTYARGISSVAAGSLAVELLPEGTHRLGSRTPIGPRLAHVIDKTPTVRSGSRTLLEGPGFEVEAFAGRPPAAHRWADRMPDVVVMEPHDRGPDALDVLRRWHAQVPSP